jgi:hypothetical protein
LRAQRCHWLAPTSDMGRVGRGGYRVSIWACSHVLRHRQVRLNAPNPGLEATLASEKHRNEVEEQLAIMLLPMPLRRTSAVGQWRGAYSHDTNHRFRTISIAKIGGSKLFPSRAPENEAVRDRRPHGGERRIRGPLQPRAVPRRLNSLPAISPYRQTPIQWDSPMHDEAHGDAFGWGSTVPTAR